MSRGRPSCDGTEDCDGSQFGLMSNFRVGRHSDESEVYDRRLDLQRSDVNVDCLTDV